MTDPTERKQVPRVPTSAIKISPGKEKVSKAEANFQRVDATGLEAVVQGGRSGTLKTSVDMAGAFEEDDFKIGDITVSIDTLNLASGTDTDVTVDRRTIATLTEKCCSKIIPVDYSRLATFRGIRQKLLGGVGDPDYLRTVKPIARRVWEAYFRRAPQLKALGASFPKVDKAVLAAAVQTLRKVQVKGGYKSSHPATTKADDTSPTVYMPRDNLDCLKAGDEPGDILIRAFRNPGQAIAFLGKLTEGSGFFPRDAALLFPGSILVIFRESSSALSPEDYLTPTAWANGALFKGRRLKLNIFDDPYSIHPLMNKITVDHMQRVAAEAKAAGKFVTHCLTSVGGEEDNRRHMLRVHDTSENGPWSVWRVRHTRPDQHGSTRWEFIEHNIGAMKQLADQCAQPGPELQEVANQMIGGMDGFISTALSELTTHCMRVYEDLTEVTKNVTVKSPGDGLGEIQDLLERWSEDPTSSLSESQAVALRKNIPAQAAIDEYSRIMVSKDDFDQAEEKGAPHTDARVAQMSYAMGKATRLEKLIRGQVRNIAGLIGADSIMKTVELVPLERLVNSLIVFCFDDNIRSYKKDLVDAKTIHAKCKERIMFATSVIKTLIGKLGLTLSGASLEKLEEMFTKRAVPPKEPTPTPALPTGPTEAD